MRRHLCLILALVLLSLPACVDVAICYLTGACAAGTPTTEVADMAAPADLAASSDENQCIAEDVSESAICCPGGADHCTEGNKVQCFKPPGVCCRFCREPCGRRAPR